MWILQFKGSTSVVTVRLLSMQIVNCVKEEMTVHSPCRNPLKTKGLAVPFWIRFFIGCAINAMASTFVLKNSPKYARILSQVRSDSRLHKDKFQAGKV